jgi:hypothetical protein
MLLSHGNGNLAGEERSASCLSECGATGRLSNDDDVRAQCRAAFWLLRAIYFHAMQHWVKGGAHASALLSAL